MSAAGIRERGRAAVAALAVAARVTVGAGITAAAGIAMGAAASPASAQAAGEWANSAQVYKDTCRYCHDGKLAPILLGAGLSRQAIVAAVRRGPGGMPSFPPAELSDRELEQLARWVRAQPKPGASTSPSAQVPPSESDRTSPHATRARRR
ncbi:MAG: c-type cytochrome [Steroidobacteraceae bacterium]